MKKLLPIFALFSTLLLASPSAFSWDGTVAGKIQTIEVAPGGNYGFRVSLVGSPSMCTGGTTWAFLNDTDSNYKIYVATMLLAKAQGLGITIFTSAEGGYCRIGYIVVGS
jgi:hypothetical protein